MASTDERIHQTVTKLLIEQPFYGALALKLHIKREDAVQTMGVNNGTRLYYNEEFVNNLSDAELMGVLAHELQHLVLGHPWREGDRHHLRWNIACDESFNWLLKKFGFKLPKDALDDPKYHNMSAEEIYSKLLDDPNYSGLGALEKLMSGQTTFDKASAIGKDGEMTQVDWQIAAQQAAAMAKAAGNLPGELERLLEALTKAKADWVSILRRFVDENIQPSNYSWTRPNRRYMAEGTYLPGVVKENTPRIGIGIDTSGSISNKLLQQFAAELDGIMSDVMPECLEIVYCDADVRGVDIFEFGSGPIKFTPFPGGGGTAFQPVFNHFNDNPPACLIYFTDMDCFDKPEKPNYPTLFIAPANSKEAPFDVEKVEVDFEY